MNPAKLTLREWYVNHFQSLFHADARPGTIEAYLNTLKIWERVSANKPLAEITQLDLAEFRMAAPGRPATIAKHARHLNHLLTKLGQPGPRNRDALGILERVPWCKPPRCELSTPMIPSDTDVARFIQNAAIQFAFFAVIAATTGSRNTAIRMLNANAVDVGNQVIRFPAETDKRRVERIKPLPAITTSWWKQHSSLIELWPKSRSGFLKRWRQESKLAGSPTLRPHGLKRWWAARLVRANATPWAVKFALDHSQNDVTGIHYLRPFDELATLVDKIELPAAFAQRLKVPSLEKEIHCGEYQT